MANGVSRHGAIERRSLRVKRSKGLPGIGQLAIGFAGIGMGFGCHGGNESTDIAICQFRRSRAA